MKKTAITSAALLLLAGGLAAQDKPQPPRAEKVKVPLEALGEILKRHPNGRMMSDRDWKELLNQAGVKSLDDLNAQPEAEKPPVAWTVSGASFKGDLRGEQIVFSAEATVRVLEAKGAILVPLPLAQVGARAVTVDGTDAKLVRGDGGYSVILEGAGEKKVAWTFTLPVEKGEEKGSGGFFVPLLRSSVATSLKLALPGDLEVVSGQCALSIERDSRATGGSAAVTLTTASAAVGAREAVRVDFRPRTAEAEATPYITVEDASCFVVRRGLVSLELAAHFSIHRTGAERFAIELPAGFSVRSVDAQTKDRNERAAPWGGNWVQRGDRVELALPKARQGELAVILRAELVAPQEGAVEMKLAAYPGAARASGLVGVARAEDMNVVVSGAKSLERADLDALNVRNLGGVLRVYRHGSATGSVSVGLKPIEPKVNLTLRTQENLLDRELRLQARYDFRVTEGKVYQFRCELPESWRVDRTSVVDEYERPLKHDLRTEAKGGKTGLIVDLEGGVKAGQSLRVDVTAAREVPAGIASEKTLPVPLLAGTPATNTTGYFAFSIDEQFRLKGDVKGLLPIPVEALARVGLPGSFALAFKVDRPDYTGALTLVKKETRIAARTLVYHQVDERTIATDAKIDFDIQGAPVETLEVLVPAEASRLVRIEGDDVAGDSPAADMKDGIDRHQIRLKGPRSGRVTVFVHFDTQVAGFEKAEGPAKAKAQLPAVHAGCERERGQLAVFSSDSTEITAEPQHLHPIEGTELEQHPGIKPAGRPLCAFSYAGMDGKLGIEIVRHEGASILSAIVEQLTITSSFGKDGLSRHTAKFRCKNLSYQFFNLKVPDGAQIWSVLVDGVGVKPAADGDQKIIPLTKAGSPDKAVEVAVTYEVKNATMGKFGSGALTSPVLLDKGSSAGGQPIPVLKTSWSLALPDDFRYFEFAGNAEGGVAAVETPLLVRWWERDADTLVLLAGITIFILALLAGEKSREKLFAIGRALGGALAAAPKAAKRIELPRKRTLVGLGGLAVLCCLAITMVNGARDRMQETYFKSSAPIDDHVTRKINGGGRAHAPEGRRPVAPRSPAPSDAPAPAPPMAPAEAPMPEEPAPAKEESDHNEDMDKAIEKAPEKPMAQKPAGPMKQKKAGERDRRELSEKLAAKESQAEGKKDANLFLGAPVDAKPTTTTALAYTPGADQSTKGEPTLGVVDTSRAINLDDLSKQQKQLAHRPLSKSSAFGEKGLSSLVLALPYVGKTWTFTHEGGPAEIEFSFVRSDVWAVFMGLFAILGFAAGFFVPRKTKVSYVALLVLSFVVLSTVPYVIAPSLTGGPVNAFLAGLALSAPVIALLSIDRARLRRVKLLGFVAPRLPQAPSGTGAALVVLGAILFSAAPAHAQERRVYVPYDPEHPDKKQEKVFVPEDLYDELWKKAHPTAKAADKPVPPAAYAVSGVKYEGVLKTNDKGSSELELKARFRIEILREGWVEAPIGLEGASVKESVIAPEGAKIRPGAGGYAVLAQGPKTFDVTLTLLLPEQGGVFTSGSIRAGAATVNLSTPEKDKAIKVLGALGGQTETASGSVDASLGAAPQLRIAFGHREVIASGGGSDASARTESIYYVRRGRVELSQNVTFSVSGEGREAFLFSVPAGVEVTSVDTEAMRGWSVKDGVLHVSLRRPCGRTALVTIRGERATSGATVELPEVAARAVTREGGRFAIAVEPGLKVKFGKDDGLRQIDATDVSVRVRNVTAERAYAFENRPAKLGVELLDEALELRCTARSVGVVHLDRVEVLAELEYVVKKGRTYELRVLAPKDLELSGDPAGLDVRERVVDVIPAGTRYTFGLAKALATSATAVVKLRFTRTLRSDDTRVTIPDVRALDVAQEDGEVALCVAEGLVLKGEKDVEQDRFSSTDPEPIARSLGAKDAKAQLGWRRKAKAPTGLSAATATIEHPRAHVEGTVIVHATVERDVLRTVIRAVYELSQAGTKEFHFRIPSRLQKRISVVAPNQREITFGATATAEGDEERIDFTVQLQSAVRNFYELTMEWEELIPAGKPFGIARLDLVNCDRARAFVMVEADPSLTDKLEASRPRLQNVESVRAEQGFGLPPGKDPRDFAECFRAEKPEWRVVLELKPVEQQAPAPCRVETAKVTSVVREDGSVLHRAVYRVRNRSLQFLGVKLPKGATVWTVHVAGEPKRLHTQNGVSLIPLPKRADADMGFEVQVIYKTQLDGGLGLLTKITPLAPVLATKDVTVERTFWTIHLPPKFEAAWTGGNMDETAAAVQETQTIKARVQELAKLSSIAENAKSETERQVAYRNIEDNYALVQRDWSAVKGLNDQTLALTVNPQKVQGQLMQAKKELEQLQSALGEVQKRQAQIGGKQAQMVQQRSQQAQQLELTYGANKFVAKKAENWRYSSNSFKQDQSMQFEGLEKDIDLPVSQPELNEQKAIQEQIDSLSAAQNRIEDEKIEKGRNFDPEPRHDSTRRGGDKGNKNTEGGGNFTFDGEESNEPDMKGYDSRKKREALGKDRASRSGEEQGIGGGGQGGYGNRGRVVNDPAKMPPNAPKPARQVPVATPDGNVVANNGPVTPQQGFVGRFNKMEEAEAKKTLLSIGFEFEVPAGSEPLHFTTASNTEEGMQLNLTVLPRTSVERGGRIGRALVVLLVIFAAVRIGLLGGTDKKLARALGVIVAGCVAGLVFVHPAFTAIAVVGSIVALIKSRRG